MTESLFQTVTPGVDVEKLMAEIQAEVAQKTEQGLYADARIARAERLNLVNLKDDEDFLACYLRSLREAAFVDINDFEIRERRATALAPLLVRFKQSLWKILKFYTYRLWSQQNMVNGLLVTGVEALDEKYQERIKRLETRIAELEAQLRKQG